MRSLIKVTSILLTISILFSACGANSVEKSTAQIEEYLKANQYNECLQYVSGLEADVKNQISVSALSLISSEYNELITENNANINDSYALDSIDKDFAENCRKLWNIAKAFNITSEYENYTDFIYLHYYAEMCNYTKYGEIYSLLEKVHESGYLNKITDAMYAYDNDGDSFAFDDAYKAALMFDYGEFNPQEYLVEDYRNAHNNAVKSLKSLSNGFATSDVNVIASSMSDLEESLSTILYITDTLNAIYAKQIFIFNELSNGELNTVFSTDLEIKKRDYEVGITFALDNIFGENVIEEDNNILGNDSVTDERISKNDALKIAVNAINKTKAYQSKLNVTYSQTKNIQMTSFETDTSINDTVELAKSTINNTLENTNGTQKTDILFNKGVSGSLSLNTFIPPSDRKAIGNADSVKEYKVVTGSGGYVISITFLPEATTNGSAINGVGSLINGFSFEGNESISEYKSSYSTATVMVTVNNSGLLEKMEYEIAGISDCIFVDDNDDFAFETQFSFSEEYSYSFEY